MTSPERLSIQRPSQMKRQHGDLNFDVHALKSHATRIMHAPQSHGTVNLRVLLSGGAKLLAVY